MIDRPYKRRFQADIKDYLNLRPCPISAPHAEPPFLSSTTSSPLVPASIQSSLLNVGMRIRKSVPEGYKTKRCDHIPRQGNNRGFCRSYTGYAELVPFCGMVKTGGHDVQSHSFQGQQEMNMLDGIWFHGDDEGASLPSSQESIQEPGAVTMEGEGHVRGGKRRFVGEEEGEEDAENDTKDDKYAMGRTNTSPQASIALRPIAQARKRKMGATPKGNPYDGDFEEAAFLRSLDECMEFDD